jgi:hypothetical protein
MVTIVEEVPMAGEFASYICAFCNQPTDDDPLYVHIGLDSPHSADSQALGAHAACLRGAVHDSIPLAVE